MTGIADFPFANTFRLTEILTTSDHSIMLKYIFFSLAGFITTVTGYPQQTHKDPEKPNIILLLVDDLGWNDVGFMGSKYYHTPNLDKLSAQSMVFTNAYAACAVCSPTRASILTGRYPARIGITDWIRARFQVDAPELKAPEPYQENIGRLLKTPSNPFWMELSEVTIAEVLKKAGYFTCHIGKWHLGPDDYYPEKQGYDVNIAGSDMGQPVNYFDPYDNENGVTFPNLEPRKNGEYLVDRLSDELTTVIEQHRNKPFFINMSFYAVHTPLMGKPELVEKYKLKDGYDGQNNSVYAAMVESMDQAVGKMMNSLRENDLIDNTIVIFLSDNGGLLGATDNAPLRSGKGYPYEGGIRIPMMVYWKDQIEKGTKCSVPISTIDILPTICAMTSSPLPKTKLDGRDISPCFRNGTFDQMPLFWHFPHYRGNDVVPYGIVRDGEWKLIKRYEGVEFELFNLKDDLQERKDLSEKYPDKVRELNDKYQAWLMHTNAKVPVAK